MFFNVIYRGSLKTGIQENFRIRLTSDARFVNAADDVSHRKFAVKEVF